MNKIKWRIVLWLLRRCGATGIVTAKSGYHEGQCYTPEWEHAGYRLAVAKKQATIRAILFGPVRMDISAQMWP